MRIVMLVSKDGSELCDRIYSRLYSRVTSVVTCSKVYYPVVASTTIVEMRDWTRDLQIAKQTQPG
jgi:hypothetical protein